MKNKTKVYPIKKIKKLNECCIWGCENNSQNNKKKNIIKLNCGHYLCKDCLKNLILTNFSKKEIRCPLCREEYNIIERRDLGNFSFKNNDSFDIYIPINELNTNNISSFNNNLSSHEIINLNNTTSVNIMNPSNTTLLNLQGNFCFVFCWTKLGLQVLLVIVSYTIISYLLVYIICQNQKNFNCIQCLFISFFGPFIAGYPISYIFIEKLKNYKHKNKINILWAFLFASVMFILIGTSENCDVKYYLLWTPLVWFVCFFVCIYKFTENK